MLFILLQSPKIWLRTYCLKRKLFPSKLAWPTFLYGTFLVVPIYAFWWSWLMTITWPFANPCIIWQSLISKCVFCCCCWPGLVGSYMVYIFFFFFLLYNIVLVLPYIKMNPPQVYMCSPSWALLPPPSSYHPSGSSQCTSPKHPVSCLEPGLVTHFIYDIIHVSVPFSQIIPPCPSPTESKKLFYTVVSLLLSHIQGYCEVSQKEKHQYSILTHIYGI